ncbi:MAG: hypothetical protein WCZ18_08210, partial [Ottowia sp.]
ATLDKPGGATIRSSLCKETVAACGNCSPTITSFPMRALDADFGGRMPTRCMILRTFNVAFVAKYATAIKIENVILLC